MEKPGIEPATPGLQGIALIHYTRGASQKTVEQVGDAMTVCAELLASKNVARYL